VGSNAGAGPNNQFLSSSAPGNYNVTGTRNFCMVTDGVLRIAIGQIPIAPDIPTCLAYPNTQ
jgi:hypothetical protein